MATNKLFEAAAEILSGSKGKNAMPMEKMPGSDAVDLGGPTPQNSKPMDDSEKIHATKAAKSATAPTTKPSNASPDTQLKMKQEDTEVESDEMIDDEGIEIDVTEDINALFADDKTISEDFKQKAATIFEARVTDKVHQIEEQIEERYASMLEEAVDAIKTDLEEKVNDYLSYVVENWMEENQIAIETGLRSELTEEFISGLRNLFAEHYIDVPSEKVDIVEELAVKVEELETRLNEEMERNIETKRALVESTKQQITYEVTDGLTDTQVEKIKSLAESVNFSTEEEYKQKLETIRENYFPSSVKKTDVEQLHEKVEEGTEKPVITDNYVAAVTQAISKTSK
jgi:hypothetical protein